MKKWIVLLLAVVCLVILSAAAAEGGADGDRILTRFELTRSTDLPSVCYEIFLLEDGYYLSRYDGAAQPAETETVRALQKLLEEYGVFSWDGFSGSNSHVLDGEGFRLYIGFSDGTSVQASGSNDFPDGYFDAADAMEELLSGIPYNRYTGVTGTYRYGENFFLSLLSDGTYETAFDGSSGGGRWDREGARIYLSGNGKTSQYNTLIPITGALVLVGEESDGFRNADIPDGGRLIRLDSAEAAAEGFPSSPMTVGTDVSFADVTEFYYTYASSTYPPDCQRYHLFIQEGAFLFEHETREGDHFPLTEEDATVSGRKELTADEWREFLGYLSGGTVKAREESLDSGDDGPWLYLYWNGDNGVYQEYTFPSWQAEGAFESFCGDLGEN